MAAKHSFNLLPHQPWELNAAASAGLTMSQFRFMISFMASVLVGAVLRKIPTVRGKARCAGR